MALELVAQIQFGYFVDAGVEPGYEMLDTELFSPRVIKEFGDIGVEPVGLVDGVGFIEPF